MTKLEAVNEMLEAINEPPDSALDTGGTSDTGEAETILDRESRRIQKRGWWMNTERDRELHRASHKLTVTSAGTFTFEETITGGSSGATAILLYQESTTALYVHTVSGTFTAAETITGGSSGATATFSSSESVSASKIAINTDWISVRPWFCEWIPFTTRGGFLYWPDAQLRYDEDDGTQFGHDVRAQIIKELDFTDLSDALQDYTIKAASLAFARYKLGDQYEEAVLSQEMLRAKVEAHREDTRMRKANVLNTRHVRRVTGSRNTHFIDGFGSYD